MSGPCGQLQVKCIVCNLKHLLSLVILFCVAGRGVARTAGGILPTVFCAAGATGSGSEANFGAVDRQAGENEGESSNSGGRVALIHSGTPPTGGEG